MVMHLHGLFQMQAHYSLQIASFDTNVTDLVAKALFTAVLTDNNNNSNQLTSTLLFKTAIQLNNTEIMCSGISDANFNIKSSGIMEEPDCCNSNNIVYTITHR